MAQPKNDKAKLTKGDIVKFCVLVGFLVLSVVVVIYFWPTLKQLTTDEGREALITAIQSAGPWGVSVLLALQLIQVIVAAIPGEVVQIVAGILYGPIWGTLIILLGALLSTMFVYWMVRKLGTPFVNKIVPEETRHKLEFITKTNKIDILVFILFLIPGLPKDFLTYLIALTDVRPHRFFIFSTLGRVPGVIASTYIGSSFAEGNWVILVVLIAVALVILAICAWKRDKIMALVERLSGSKKHHADQVDGEKPADSIESPAESDVE